MTYPRRCPLCGADCGGARKRQAGISLASEFRHTTLSAEPGGTPSPWRPELPGRLLALRCLACDGEYGWDYFGGQPVAGAVPASRLPRQAAPPRRQHLVLPGSRLRTY